MTEEQTATDQINPENVQYEYVDENGNPIETPEALENIQYEEIDPNSISYEYVEEEVPSNEAQIQNIANELESVEEVYEYVDENGNPVSPENIPQEDGSISLEEVNEIVDQEQTPAQEMGTLQATEEVYEYVDENGNPVDPNALEAVSSDLELPAETETPQIEIPTVENLEEPPLETEDSVPAIPTQNEIFKELEEDQNNIEPALEEVPLETVPTNSIETQTEPLEEPSLEEETVVPVPTDKVLEDLENVEVPNIEEPALGNETFVPAVGNIDDIPEALETVPEVSTAESLEAVPEEPVTESLEAIPEEPATENLEAVPEEPATESLEAIPEEPVTESLETVPEEPTTESLEAVPEEPATESLEAVPEETTTESLEAVPEEPATESLETVPEEPATENLEAVPEENSIENAQEQVKEVVKEDNTSTINDNAFIYNGSNISTFNGSESNSTISLSNANGSFNNLSAWHLILSDLSISQIETQPGQSIPLPDEIYNQGTLITGDGSQIVFANTNKLDIPSQEPDTCTLFLCGTTDISLADQNGSTLELETPTSGMLIGPNNTKLTFNDVTKFVIPLVDINSIQKTNVQETTSAPKSNGVMNLTLSQLDQKAFVFDGSENQTTNNETIIVKTGYSLYGWNVAFESGLNMSLSDLRTYQSKNHSLPETNGTITYKDKELSFSSVKSIKIFEVPTYCGYGKA